MWGYDPPWPSGYLPLSDQWLSSPEQPSVPAYVEDDTPAAKDDGDPKHPAGERKRLTWDERRIKRKAAKKLRQAIKKNLQARRARQR